MCARQCRCAHSHKYVMKVLTEGQDPIWPSEPPAFSLMHTLSPSCSPSLSPVSFHRGVSFQRRTEQARKMKGDQAEENIRGWQKQKGRQIHVNKSCEWKCCEVQLWLGVHPHHHTQQHTPSRTVQSSDNNVTPQLPTTAPSLRIPTLTPAPPSQLQH